MLKSLTGQQILSGEAYILFSVWPSTALAGSTIPPLADFLLSCVLKVNKRSSFILIKLGTIQFQLMMELYATLDKTDWNEILNSMFEYYWYCSDSFKIKINFTEVMGFLNFVMDHWLRIIHRWLNSNLKFFALVSDYVFIFIICEKYINGTCDVDERTFVIYLCLAIILRYGSNIHVWQSLSKCLQKSYRNFPHKFPYSSLDKVRTVLLN